METTQFTKQALEFQKTILENSFSAMIMVQDQTEKMINSCLNQLPLVTEDGKKSLQASIDMAKKARDDYKKFVDDGFNKIEELLEKNSPKKSVASQAAKILSDEKSSKTVKKLAGSALAQADKDKQTSAELEELASKVLKSEKYSLETKELAGSVLSPSNKER